MSQGAPHALPAGWEAGLWLLGGLLTALLVHLLGDMLWPLASRPALLLLAGSTAGLGVAGLWLALLALRQSTGWGAALFIALPLPYVNVVVASLFARRYWQRGARRPGLLACASFLAQTAGSVLLLSPPQPSLV